MAKFTRILSIDGGGIRGIIAGQVLVALEEKLQAAGGPQARIADYFDLVAGTSTGGILTCALLTPGRQDPQRPRFSAREAVDLYLERGDEIFDIPVLHRIRSVGGIADEKYPSDGLEEALEDYFEDFKLSNLLKPCLITAYDIKRRRAHFFRQQKAKEEAGFDFLIRDVARATSAAPTYFEASRVKSLTNVTYPLIDGGVFANNPAMCAYAEARNFEGTPRARNMLVLSLGTGSAETSYAYREAKDWGLVEWAKPILDIIMTGVAETVDYQLQQIFDTVEAPAGEPRYLRIQADLSREPAEVRKMDNAELENLARLGEIGTELAQNYSQELDQFVKLLKAD